jgi:hypothetical protein
MFGIRLFTQLTQLTKGQQVTQLPKGQQVTSLTRLTQLGRRTNTHVSTISRYPRYRSELGNEKSEQQLLKTTFNIDYDELHKINWHNEGTRDGCIHYYHQKTNVFYSWNFLEQHWKESHPEIKEMAIKAWLDTVRKLLS